MVTYATWVGIVRTEAAEQGADLSDFDTNSEVISVAAGIWRDRKEELRSADGRSAERIAEQEVSVQ